MKPLISVVLPTIAGREAWLERAVASLNATCPGADLIVVRDRPACGIAWRDGAAMAVGDYVVFSADDVEWLPGWWQAGARACDDGLLPAPLIFAPDGSVASCGGTAGVLEPDGAVTEFTRIPFLSAAQLEAVGPMLPIHYYSDAWVSFRGRQVGIETVACHGYRCVHHSAGEGRSEPWQERLLRDRAEYERYRSGELAP